MRMTRLETLLSSLVGKLGFERKALSSVLWIEPRFESVELLLSYKVLVQYNYLTEGVRTSCARG